MGVKVSGGSVSILGFGVKWDVTQGDKKVARSVIAFLEDRRLLFGNRHGEDQPYSIESALSCRTFLTAQIALTTSGKPLEASLKSMRAAFRQFVERGGPQGISFDRDSWHSADPYALALVGSGFELTATRSLPPNRKSDMGRRTFNSISRSVRRFRQRNE